MSQATRLAHHIERTVTGPMWHGPALADVLDGVTRDRALAHPLLGAHSIWEIVLHITVWCDIARLRVQGQATEDPTPEQDWPPVPAACAEDWPIAVERLHESHRRLAADVLQLTDAQLDAKVPGLGYAVGVMLSGIVEHGTYHGGQIALLRRAGGQP